MKLGLGLGIDKRGRQKDYVLDKLGLVDSYIIYFSYVKLTKKHKGPCMQIMRLSDSAVMDINFVGEYMDTAAIASFGLGTECRINIFYDPKGLNNAVETVWANMIVIYTAGTIVDSGTKHQVYEPVGTESSITLNPLSLYQRFKNLNSSSMIVMPNTSSVITGYTADYVTPIKCSAGVMDFSITSGTDVFWYLADGTTSTATKPAKNMAAGVSYLFSSNNNTTISSNSTNTLLIGKLKDFSNITYALSLSGCSNITGSIADLQGKITYTLSLSSCINITGSIADLQGKITYFLSVYNCGLVTGSIADLQGKIENYLSVGLCSLINSAYNPNTAAQTPTTFNIRNTGLSATDVDNTLINCAAKPKTGVTFTWTGLSRTAASDAAKALLKGTYSWTFVPDV